MQRQQTPSLFFISLQHSCFKQFGAPEAVKHRYIPRGKNCNNETLHCTLYSSRVGDAGAAVGAYNAVSMERDDASKECLRAQLQGFRVEHSERALGRGSIVKNREKRTRVLSAANFGNKVSLGEVNVRGAPRGDYVATCSRR